MPSHGSIGAHGHKSVQRWRHGAWSFIVGHGAPLALCVLLGWLLWWGHTPQVLTVEEAMRHVAWVGVGALIYVALQARAVLAQPRSGVVHALIEILVAMLPLFLAGYGMIDWLRGRLELNLFQVIVMWQAVLASLIDVVIFTWFSLRLGKLSLQAPPAHAE
jgi:hypothetical protein